MKRALVGLTVACAALTATDAAAQTAFPFSVEARLDAGIPVGDSSDALKTGVGFGVDAALEIAPVFAIYGGYSKFSFDLKGSDRSGDDDGFDLGGRVSLGTGGGVYTPYAMLGALFHNDHTGLEAGLGVDYPVSTNLSLTPLVRYRTIGDLDYLTLGAGLRIRL